jgi:hypothetical protein
MVSAVVPVAHWVDFETPSRNIICTTGRLPQSGRAVGIDCVVFSVPALAGKRAG